MDVENFECIDILAFTTEELQERFRSAKNVEDQEKIIDDFLGRWEADPGLDVLKKMKIEFEKDLDWFNVTQPLTMEALRGKLVVLDFFTYCCINCMHVLPELRALEELFSTERGLVVVGVHSPKFENEKAAANILAASQRFGITHPIVNDPRSLLWRAVGIRCWPSLLVLSPGGAPLLLLMGEGHSALLQCFTEQALRHFERKGEVARFELPLRPSTDLMPASNLCFPAKIARSEDGYYFAIADAGNHRILITDRNGVVHHKIGNCVAGLTDGGFDKARFNSPQGVAFLDEDRLIVADTENHALRQITLSTCHVETLAGTGQQGNDRLGGNVGPLQPISSPWDVAVFRTRDMDMSFHLDERNVPEKPIVLVSMAGTHQIWGYFPTSIIWWKFRKFEPRTCVSLCGNGLEENRNNSYPQNAAFAQPSGLAMAKDFMFIADSESSSIRKVSLVDGKVMAVVGGDRNPLNLFAFGDVDGKQYSAKLQHPLGVAYNHSNEKVYVADTFNHKIKVIDTTTNTIETLQIKNESGEEYQFNEPAGLCFDASGQFLLVSDTNNHNIQTVDLQTLTTKLFKLDFAKSQLASETDAPLTKQLLKRLPLRTCKELILRVAITLGDGLKLTAEAPQKWSLNSSESALHSTNTTTGVLQEGKFAVHLQRLVNNAVVFPQQKVKLDIALSLCDDKSCLMKRFSLIVCDDVEAGTGEAEDIVVEENINVHITPIETSIRQ